MKNEIINRFKAETPSFFKKVRNISISVSGACLAVATFYPQLPTSMQELIPSFMMKYIAVSGIVAAFVAQLAKQDNTTQNA